MADKRPPKYAIVNTVDAPTPEMVAQWIPGVGYCYLDRTGNKPSFDGMPADEATGINTFGITVFEHGDGPNKGKVDFLATGRSFARYHDGLPRLWQDSRHTFTHTRLHRMNMTRFKKRTES